MQDAGSHICQYTVLYLSILVLCYIDERNSIQGVRRIGSSVGIQGIVGISVVGNDDGLVTHLLGGLYHLVHALVNGLNSSLDSLVNTCMAYHIAIGKVNYDKVVLILLDGSHQLILNLKGTHLGLQIVSGNLRTGNQDTLLTLVGSLTTSIEEEGNMSVLLRFCRM